MLCRRILQSALVCVNTLMLQDVLADPEWADPLTPADRRGLTPLFWSHVRPYEEVDARLNLTAVTVPGARGPTDTHGQCPGWGAYGRMIPMLSGSPSSPTGAQWCGTGQCGQPWSGTMTRRPRSPPSASRA